MNKGQLNHIREIFIDTSAYISLVRSADDYHHRAVEMAKNLSHFPIKAYTTNFILAETHAFLLSRLGYSPALKFIDEIESSSTQFIRVTAQDEDMCKKIIRQYKDKEFAYTDATSFAVMERLGIDVAFTFDHHFNQYGFRMLQDLM